MGLDMYLKRKTYVKTWDHTPKEQKFEVSIKYAGKKCAFIKPSRITYITEEVGYWRKANHIHSWFVKNVQKGKDDCGEHYVPEDKLKELLKVCEKVKKDPEKGEELLPTQSGFFFGSTEYDEYYMKDIDYTIKIITDVLKEQETYNRGDLYYGSSW